MDYLEKNYPKNIIFPILYYQHGYNKEINYCMRM